jgi:hypothetical protein
MLLWIKKERKLNTVHSNIEPCASRRRSQQEYIFFGVVGIEYQEVKLEEAL